MTTGPQGERVFIRLGPPPDEPNQFATDAAPRCYPPEVRARLEVDAKEIIGRYPDKRSALLPLLHLVQGEDSYLTPAGLAFCADQLGLTGAEVSAVASFYTMYRRRPTGEYLVGVCTNTLCAVMGGDAIFDSLTEHLGVGHDETTPDGAITLQHIECNAACDYAPVVMVNWEFFDNQTCESARALADSLRAGKPLAPTRGAPLCGFRQTARILAGLPDQRPDGGQGGPGAATVAGLRVAHENDMQAPPPPGAGQ
ncbi:NADH-quinone oxidoreductase subunit NuoE [Mycobacterium shinjukuense]|uniref:NADH-quinone oxidoreductase subunit E n=1 Tax=Mycobacterium shinjukuense TaxID=398694 RepID=A0A7I7MQD4_9MYCO|nr:NADH-quinone oxidoreductase subunit NuoE [Mycobacterium shinjukuense]MCV6985548.1 NADH-quinone oxidoreductase subunit NuoE [Mycobacterium shinjukuense]ORB68140.1 NADH-quinone oxidoreductase subunit E [Mycobacterium shinjukuense]BBX74471.1 NADH-quinone oxidoreductase subunit E [Mycobacterium shinjukuense]